MKKSPLVFSAFALCIMYWIYLACTAEMVIGHDALGYERLGTLIHTQGFGEYLRTGPNREPLYPLLIAFSMSLSERLHVGYSTVQIFFQLFILFSTQLILLKLLRALGISSWISAFTIFYFGISPAVVNSAFRLYSEITAYPLVLGIIWLTHKLMDSAWNSKFCHHSFCLGLLLVLITMVKGIFEAIIPLNFLGLILAAALRKWLRLNFFMLLAAAYFSFFLPVTAYKWANKIANGHFALTDRGAYALYGSTARRVQNLSGRQILAGMAYVPHWRFCEHFFTPEECAYWSYTTSDSLGFGKQQELSEILPAQKIDKELFKLSLQKAGEKPLQYFLLTFLEGFKLFFWESPSMQYVYYPDPVIKFYSLKPINLSLYIVMPILTILAVGYGLIFIFKKSAPPLIGIILVFIISYAAAYSFFLILDRYSFPLIPLYLILIAWMAHHILKYPWMQLR